MNDLVARFEDMMGAAGEAVLALSAAHLSIIGMDDDCADALLEASGARRLITAVDALGEAFGRYDLGAGLV